MLFFLSPDMDLWLALTKETWAACWVLSGQKLPGPACVLLHALGPAPSVREVCWDRASANLILNNYNKWGLIVPSMIDLWHEQEINFIILSSWNLFIIVTMDKSSLFWLVNILKAVVTKNCEVKARTWDAELNSVKLHSYWKEQAPLCPLHTLAS